MIPSLNLGPCPTRILGSAAAFPPPVDTPTLLARLAPDLPSTRRDALLAHLATQLGVASRGHLALHQDPLDLAIQAARGAIDDATHPDIGAILLATSTASRWTTAESARLANALDLDVAFCDLRSGCTGGLWALIEGARLARDSARQVLVVGCDSFSRAFPPNERLLPLAMGDGAAAILLAPSDTPIGLIRAVIGGAPQHVELATVRAALPPTDPPESFTLSGDPEPFARAAEAALTSALQAIELDATTPTLIVPHVGRITTMHHLAATFALPVYSDAFIDHGNLGAASLINALHRLRSHRGPLALVSAGGGLSYGAALWHPTELA